MAMKTSVVLIAAMGLAGSVLVSPGALGSSAGGRAAIWGKNDWGQLGDGTTRPSSAPTAIGGPLAGATITDISTAGTHTCAVADGKAWCWGWNFWGTLGNGSSGLDSHSSTPVPVAERRGVLAGRTVTAIDTGRYHTCAVADGRVFCWGRNQYGQLGNGSKVAKSSSSAVPVAVTGAIGNRTVTDISAGDSHTCAVADGRPYCWGLIGLVSGAAVPPSEPVAVDTSGALAGKKVTAISSGGQVYACAVADGKAYCWGHNFAGQLGNGVDLTDDVDDWGSPEPAAVIAEPGLLAGRKVTDISAGGFHVCAIADGKAFCWGNNEAFQLGDGSGVSSSKPVAVLAEPGVLGGATVTAISAGGTNTCAVAGGKAFCWGPSLFGDSTEESIGSVASTGGSFSTKPVAVDASGVLAGKTVTAVSTSQGVTAVLFATAVPLAKAKGVDVVVNNNRARITWKPVRGATSYRARISKPGGSAYRKWVTTTKRRFTAKVRDGERYRLQLRAIGPAGRGPVTTIRFKAT